MTGYEHRSDGTRRPGPRLDWFYGQGCGHLPYLPEYELGAEPFLGYSTWSESAGFQIPDANGDASPAIFVWDPSSGAFVWLEF